MSKPITPTEITESKAAALPNVVFEAFSDAIVAAWDGWSAKVKQASVAMVIAARLDISQAEVYNRGFLDVEPIYRKAGWKVKYDKPGYNESYEAYFEFTK